METSNQSARLSAIHLLRSGKKPQEVADELGRSLAWVYKWQARFNTEGWSGVKARSRAPKRRPKRLPDRVRQAVRAARSELEAEAEQPGNLSYIGAHAVQARLRQKRVRPLPSISSIERELRRAGMTQRQEPQKLPEIQYPHLSPSQPGQLVQVDIQPHYLKGGSSIACFNALDVVSRYPSGQQFSQKRSQEALAFVTQVWQEIGLADYTQFDNESCFGGGFTHPYVLGRVLRLALYVGTQPVFSPFYHPKSNGFVERFHRDYDRHVWLAHELPNLAAVRQHSPTFFQAYRRSRHHSALDGRSPAQVHQLGPQRCLPVDFKLPKKLPVTAGQAHFMRKVDQHGCIRILNVDWSVPGANPDDGVWATLTIRQAGAKLSVYNAAPDVRNRRRLAVHPFPLNEPVAQLLPQFRRPPSRQAGLWRRTAQTVFGWISTMF